MRVYAGLARIFPTSFTAKIMFLAFCGTHVPLIAFAMWALFGSGAATTLQALGVLLAATVAGTGATLWALRTVLAPLHYVTDHLQRWEAGWTEPPLPEGFRDPLGRLMELTNDLMARADRHIDRSRAEAETDALTGLRNRRGLERAMEASSEAGYLMVFDLDHFKSVNDRYGHAAGDAALRGVAQAASTSLSGGHVLARVGGDEFAVWLRTRDDVEAMILAEKMRAHVARRVLTPEGPVSLSIGIAPLAADRTLEAGLAAADIALYDAKQAGRGRVHVAVPDLRVA